MAVSAIIRNKQWISYNYPARVVGLSRISTNNNIPDRTTQQQREVVGPSTESSPENSINNNSCFPKAIVGKLISMIPVSSVRYLPFLQLDITKDCSSPMLSSYCSTTTTSSGSSSSGGLANEAMYLNTAVASRIDRLTDCLMSTCYSDYWQLVLNLPFWEEEKKQLDVHVIGGFLSDPLVLPKYQNMVEAFDLLYVLEDVRDHLNELLDYSSRCGGVGGTGGYAAKPVENMEEHIHAVTETYDMLKVKYPNRLLAIEEVLGLGLSILRQKHKFRWKTMHEYSY
eukprot:GHVS01082964.1.p1 GENE.GHVS01082964.1~~GHVS01082964.1.p1  ORF type:complete len:283 (-),score=57.52 GHVS01082964.1:1684-2532(-)